MSYEASQARLNISSFGWVADGSDLDPWLEVNFMMRTKVQEIFTQGRDSPAYWVETYTLSYSSDGATFQDYVEYDTIKVIIIYGKYFKSFDWLRTVDEIAIFVR